MLLRYRADEGVLDEIIGPGNIVGQRTSIASQVWDFGFEKSTEFVYLSLQCFRQSTGRVWRLKANGTGEISITMKPSPSKIFFSAARCD
jgi:hypothetical protein